MGDRRSQRQRWGKSRSTSSPIAPSAVRASVFFSHSCVRIAQPRLWAFRNSRRAAKPSIVNLASAVERAVGDCRFDLSAESGAQGCACAGVSGKLPARALGRSTDGPSAPGCVRCRLARSAVGFGTSSGDCRCTKCDQFRDQVPTTCDAYSGAWSYNL